MPIAHQSASVPVLILAGAVVGVISGLFGVGGGFLLTPLLMFIGISPAVGAASGATGIIAASTSGTIEHSRGGTVDYKMGLVLFLGSSLGGVVGVDLLNWLNRFGPANLAIRGLYVVMLSAVGGLMLVDSIRIWRRGDYLAERRFAPIRRPGWVDRLPGQVEFPKSGIEVSLFVPVTMGILAGVLAALMGVGGGFIMVPLMLYVLRMRMHLVAGTSLFQILLTCALVTVLQARENFTVDPLLAVLLACGSTGGAMLGARVGRRLRSDQLKVLLALIVLLVAGRVALDLLRQPGVLLSHVVGS